VAGVTFLLFIWIFWW